MSDLALSLRGVHHRFGALEALSGVDISVREGDIYGFLGLNGAGKTTAIRLILGLIRSRAGEVRILGADARRRSPELFRKVGVLFEDFQAHSYLTGREHLLLHARLLGLGRAEARRMAELWLGRVGLAERAGARVRGYSLGMKRRLGLACAMVGSPRLVILDEPANGLDPAGIREFRELMRELARGGMTVFVSSHLLSEVEQMCDDVAIVKEGRLLAQGPVGTLKRGATAVEMRVTDATRAVAVLEALPWVTAVSRDGDGRLLVTAPPDRSAELSRALAEQQIYLHELRARDSSLEDFFLEVTGDGAAIG